MSDKIDLTPWENHDGPPPDFDSPAYPVFDSGVTWTIGQLAVVLSVDCNDFSWDAATEEYDGDVRAVIGNAITAALGEEWSDLRAENARLREANMAALVALKYLQSFGCPVCCGDCVSANPPVSRCPTQEIGSAIGLLRAALETPEHRLITAAKQARDIAKGTRDE